MTPLDYCEKYEAQRRAEAQRYFQWALRFAWGLWPKHALEHMECGLVAASCARDYARAAKAERDR